MLMLNNPGIRNLVICIVHYCVALEVRVVQNFCLKPQRTIFKLSVAIVIILIDHTCKQHLLCLSGKFFPVLKEIGVQADLHALKKLFNNTCIAAFGNPLIRILEIVVVIGIAKRKSLDDEGRQLFTGSSPLLAGITLYQFLIHVLSNQCQRLLLQILRMRNVHSCNLLFNLRLGFCRCPYTPQLMEGIHIKGHVVKLIFINRNGRIHKVIKLRKLVDVVPYVFSGGMENVSSVFVYIDALHFLRINITANMAALVNHQTGFSLFFRLMGKYCAKQTCAYNEIIVFFHALRPLFIPYYMSKNIPATVIFPVPGILYQTFSKKNSLYFIADTLSNSSVISLEGALVKRLKTTIIRRLRPNPTARE